jgi:hypothetical protein
VLQGADGVALIADSRVSETQHNAESFFDLKPEPQGTNGLDAREDAARHPVQQARPPGHPLGRRSWRKAREPRARSPSSPPSPRTASASLETFLALLVDGAGLIADAARQLNAPSGISELLERRLGGSFEALVGPRGSVSPPAASTTGPRTQGGRG